MNKGFTLLETLFGLAILLVAITIIYLSFTTLNNRQSLEKNTLLVASILNEARSLTLSSKDASRYGVHLESGQVVLFPGSTYTAGNASNVVTPLGSLVAIRNISLAGGGQDVIFDRLTGNTSEYGSLEVYLKSASTSFSTINISATGIVE